MTSILLKLSNIYAYIVNVEPIRLLRKAFTVNGWKEVVDGTFIVKPTHEMYAIEVICGGIRWRLCSKPWFCSGTNRHCVFRLKESKLEVVYYVVLITSSMKRMQSILKVKNQVHVLHRHTSTLIYVLSLMWVSMRKTTDINVLC